MAYFPSTLLFGMLLWLSTSVAIWYVLHVGGDSWNLQPEEAITLQVVVASQDLPLHWCAHRRWVREIHIHAAENLFDCHLKLPGQ